MGSWSDRKRVPKIKPGNVFEVIHVPGHQRNVVNNGGGGGDNRISQLHLLLLAQTDRLLDHLAIKRVDGVSLEEVENRSFLL